MFTMDVHAFIIFLLLLGEHDGMTSSLKHAQEIATNHKNQVEELEHKLQNSYVEKEQINNEKNEAS